MLVHEQIALAAAAAAKLAENLGPAQQHLAGAADQAAKLNAGITAAATAADSGIGNTGAGGGAWGTPWNTPPGSIGNTGAGGGSWGFNPGGSGGGGGAGGDFGLPGDTPGGPPVDTGGQPWEWARRGYVWQPSNNPLEPGQGRYVRPLRPVTPTHNVSTAIDPREALKILYDRELAKRVLADLPDIFGVQTEKNPYILVKALNFYVANGRAKCSDQLLTVIKNWATSLLGTPEKPDYLGLGSAGTQTAGGLYSANTLGRTPPPAQPTDPYGGGGGGPLSKPVYNNYPPPTSTPPPPAGPGAPGGGVTVANAGSIITGGERLIAGLLDQLNKKFDMIANQGKNDSPDLWYRRNTL